MLARVRGQVLNLTSEKEGTTVIHGSCYCNKVRFSANSHTPYPYMYCYCSVCRKTAGGGGYAINIMAEAESLEIQGEDSIKIYQARLRESDDSEKTEISPARRHFCGNCGSALWLADPRWSQWIYPFASAIDTPLPRPPERIYIMLDFAAPWCEIPEGSSEKRFAEYPDEAIIDWHKHHNLYDEE